MNEVMLQMFAKSLGFKPEAIKELIAFIEKVQRDSEDRKILLQDILDVDRQILGVLKKRGKG